MMLTLFRKPKLLAIVAIGFFFLSFTRAWSGETDHLNHLLDLDRFQAYLTRWSVVIHNRGNPQIADLISHLSAEDLSRMSLDPTKVADVFQYDQLIKQIVKAKAPQLHFQPTDLEWNYNFFKRKLAEAYQIQSADEFEREANAPAVLDPGEATPEGREVARMSAAEDHAITQHRITGFNVDAYVSDRTTRGVFWDASEAGRLIEYHVGSKKEFLDNAAARNLQVLGEVKAYARNYNPIYLVKEPGEAGYHYAITEISGAARLQHLTAQSWFVRWKNVENQRLPIPPMEVYGDPAITLKNEEKKLTEILRTIPKADHVVIGQKGAFERVFRALEKRQNLLQLYHQDPGAFTSLSTPDQKLIIKASQETGNEFLSSTLKNESDWDSIYEKMELSHAHLLPPLKGNTAFTVDRGSYEFSDYILKSQEGQPQRWRVFSNSWGDEVLPIANALKSTGHTEINYIGTAGALPESGLHVGDLVIPSKAIDPNGIKRKLRSVVAIPEGAKTGITVAHVATPFEETEAWLEAQKSLSQVVEVETGYLANVFKGSKDKVNTYLMISDVVGSTDETLAESSASSRRNALEDSISNVLGGNKVAGVAQTSFAFTPTEKEAWVDELLPTRDPISKFQLVQKAKQLGITSKADFEALIEQEKSFTTEKVEGSLQNSERRLKQFLFDAEAEGIIPKISVSKDFLEGRWNPSEPIAVHVRAKSPLEANKLSEILEKLKHSDPKLEKLLQVKISQAPPSAELFVKAPYNVTEITEAYNNSALRLGGLASTENRSGNLKFIKVHTRPVPNGALNYFAPDEATAEVLQKLQNPNSLEAFLKQEVDSMNSVISNSIELKEQFQVRYKIENHLPGGSKAQVEPVLGDDRFFIDLKLTPDGIRNPAVVMEELLHLQQITNLDLGWAPGQRFKSFSSPFHWVETVANAKSGSIQAHEKLARLELEAANASEHAVSFYREKNLFPGTEDQVLKDYVQKRIAHAGALYKDVQKAARADMKARTQIWNQQKLAFDGFEKNAEKLNDLIAKSDRKAVRKLISAYVPWPLLEPSEKRAWTVWLDSMEHPDPTKTKLTFRGLQDDLILRSVEGKPYLMSTVLTHNQGSYTRRLRSLTTMREKMGSHLFSNFESPYILNPDSPSSLTTFMKNHSFEARGSPFLSASDLTVAQRFGNSKMGAILIDERRLVANAFATNFLNEHEKLIPLIVFPDEMVHFHDFTLNPPPVGIDNRTQFITEVQAKIGREATVLELTGNITYLDSFHQSFASVKDMILKENAPELDANGNCLVPVMNKLFPIIP